MNVYLLLAAWFFAYVGAEVSPPTVDLPLGVLEGTTKVSLNGRKFFSFEGVPYARPPVGKYRFREPLPPKPWLGTWKANTIYRCLQYSHYGYLAKDPVEGEEDCLYLNIYTPNLRPKKPLDVIVYIHGGAFMFNYGGWQGPLYIMDKDVVYVSLNYRLGPLGFLTTEDDVVPGNNGLRDQNLALKWVNQNIEYFGGNPNSVTIMGMSAGGASVHLHYLIPESRGLFHRGFSQSGSALCPWVLMENGAEKTRKLADIVGCNNFPKTIDMINCIRRRPGRQITEAVEKFMPWAYNPFSPFGVVVDTWATEPLLPDHPYTLLKKKQVADLPWISSYTGVEGLYPGAEFYHDEYLMAINDRWNELMPFILDYNHTVNAQELPEIGQKIRDFYMKGKPVNKETFAHLMEALSDRIFLNDIEKAIRLQGVATKSPIYTYLFDYRGAHSKTEFLSGTTANLGASHADDTSYVFNTLMNTTTTDDDRKMIQLFLDFTVSFMMDGEPKAPVEWRPVEKSLTEPLTILRIDSPNDLKLEKKQSFGHIDFWETLPLKENEKLVSALKDEL